MTTGLKSYIVTNPSATLTRLTLGTTFHYRVRALNGVVKGTWTAPTKFRMASDPTNVVVATYNLCGQDKCVSKSNGMKKWSTRKAYAGQIAREHRRRHHRDAGVPRQGHPVRDASSRATRSASTTAPSRCSTAPRSTRSCAPASSRSTAPSASTPCGCSSGTATTRTMFIVVDAHLQPYKGRTEGPHARGADQEADQRPGPRQPQQVPRSSTPATSTPTRAMPTRAAIPAATTRRSRCSRRPGSPTRSTSAKTKVNVDVEQRQPGDQPAAAGTRDHVDHIFVDPAITVVQFKVIVSLNGSSYAKPFATDHNPVRATLAIPGR